MFILDYSVSKYWNPQGVTPPDFANFRNGNGYTPPDLANFRNQSAGGTSYGADRFSSGQSGSPLSTGSVSTSSPGSSYYNQFSGPFGGNQFPFGGNQFSPFNSMYGNNQFPFAGGQGQLGQQGQFGQSQFGNQSSGGSNQLAQQANQVRAQAVGNLFAIPDSPNLSPLYRFMLANGIRNPALMASLFPDIVGRLAQLTGFSSLPPQQNAQGSGSQSNRTQQVSNNPSPFPNGVPPIYRHSSSAPSSNHDIFLQMQTRDGRTVLYRQASTQQLADRIVMRFVLVRHS